MTNMARRARNQRIHLRRRALERFGIILSDEEIGSAISDLRAGKAVAVEERDNGRASYLWEIQGVKAVWVYDSKTDQLVTVISIAKFGERDKWVADRERKRLKREKRRAERERRIVGGHMRERREG